MVVGRLNERDDCRGAAACQLRQRLKAWIGSPHRNLWRKVLQLIAGQPELGEDHKVGARRPALRNLRFMQGKILREVTQHWSDLREGEYSPPHQPYFCRSHVWMAHA